MERWTMKDRAARNIGGGNRAEAVSEVGEESEAAAEIEMAGNRAQSGNVAVVGKDETAGIDGREVMLGKGLGNRAVVGRGQTELQK